jgi:hypothetical protein
MIARHWLRLYEARRFRQLTTNKESYYATQE